ncbi:MAG: 16S rRNA (cytidine(1402)-2'-O)-methyltransferase [Nitrospirota bacterium]|nr:16S rRNA (cytidine(1402)-2'-O)-methyltransferase [Nitrospirota bacterium]
MYKHGTGALYIVATPIGNLKDITLRALDVLKNVHFVAAEDTRVTRALLDHYQINTPCVSYHDHNKEEKIPVFLHRMTSGESIALVSDQGTPLISDPGSALVAETVKRGLPVHPVPGASSLLAALSASGVFSDRFLFEGFLPRRSGEIRNRLSALSERPEAIILFEAPNRIMKLLEIMEEVLGQERRICIGRELTKLYETFYRGTIPEVRTLLDTACLRGEAVLVIEGFLKTTSSAKGPDLQQVLGPLREIGASRADKARFLVKVFGIPRQKAYRIIEPDGDEQD